MKKYIHYLPLLLLFLLSAGQIVYVFFSDSLAAGAYDKVYAVCGCVPLMFLAIACMAVEKSRKGRAASNRSLLLFQCALFIPIIVLEAIDAAKAIGAPGVSPLRPIADLLIFLLMPVLLLILMMNRRNLYLVGLALLGLLIVFAFFSTLVSEQNGALPTALSSLVIYLLSAYPFLALFLRSEWPMRAQL